MKLTVSIILAAAALALSLADAAPVAAPKRMARLDWSDEFIPHPECYHGSERVDDGRDP